MELPKIVYGTSKLGNLYDDIGEISKRNIIETIISSTDETIVFDSAGKYGAGMALEVLGNILRILNVDNSRIIISNKLGWKQVSLAPNSQPTFEPGVWANLQHDCVLDISYDGIIECFNQGNALLGEGFSAQMVSVHDPDEYLSQANGDTAEEFVRMANIKEAYRALHDLKAAGHVTSVGIGSKDPRIVERICEVVDLDWVMLACSVTPMVHDDSTVSFLRKLHMNRIPVINAAVFNGGFLVGGYYCDYRKVEPHDNLAHFELLQWRDKFTSLCSSVGISPAFAAIQFSFLFDGICSVALNADSSDHAIENRHMVYMTGDFDAAKMRGRLQELWSLLANQNMIKSFVVQEATSRNQSM